MQHHCTTTTGQIGPIDSTQLGLEKGPVLEALERPCLKTQRTAASPCRPGQRHIPTFLFQNIVYINLTPQLGDECGSKEVPNLEKFSEPSHFLSVDRGREFLLTLCMEEVKMDGMGSRCRGR